MSNDDDYGEQDYEEQDYREQDYGFALEAYEVERTVDVFVGLKGREGDSRVRIEVLRDEKDGGYYTRTYIEETCTVQPTYLESAKERDFWCRFPLGSGNVPYPNPDSALAEALGLLERRCRKA